MSFGSSEAISIREASASDYEKIDQLANHFWSKSQVIRFEKEYDILKLPAYVVIANDNVSGVLSYALEPESMVIVTLDVLPGYQGLGAGRMLLDIAKEKASDAKKNEVLVSTSNDDLPAIYFYQKNGFQIFDVKPNLIAEHHGELRVGFAGISSKDELRLRYKIS